MAPYPHGVRGRGGVRRIVVGGPLGITSAEVVVVGSGVIGSSIAYHLARQGRRVLVIERGQPAIEPAASWASAGGVRRQGRDPAEAQLAIESIERWPSLSEELGADLGYQQGGNLYVGEGDEEAELVARFVERQHANGFADVRLLDSEGGARGRPGPERDRHRRQLQPEGRPGRPGPDDPRVRRCRRAARSRGLARHRHAGPDRGRLTSDGRADLARRRPCRGGGPGGRRLDGRAGADGRPEACRSGPACPRS